MIFSSGEILKTYSIRNVIKILVNYPDMFGLFYEDITSDWRKAWLATPISLLGESHQQRSLSVYILWGCKKSDITEAIWHAHTQHQISVNSADVSD